VPSARQWTVRLTAERSRILSSAINRGSSAATFRRFPQASISSSAYDSHCRIRAVTRKCTTPFSLGYGGYAVRGIQCQVGSSPPKHPGVQSCGRLERAQRCSGKTNEHRAKPAGTALHLLQPAILASRSSDAIVRKFYIDYAENAFLSSARLFGMAVS
jgi:hypothetical protein